MCSQYWTLKEVAFTCPSCGAETEDDLQTHFMGEGGSCFNYYAMNEPVAEVQGITARLPQGGEDFIGNCTECGVWVDFGARIESGAVIGVWPYQWKDDDNKLHTLAQPVV